MARPLTQSDLIFPSQSLNFSSTLHSLKRSALSITNRLSSITSDSSFVISVSEAYNLPLVANERCGSWYIPPEKKSGGVYFKSTDGHMNQWSFNLRRLNLQVLDLVGGGAGGCVIVDSTRRGKSMPDALSKTIPIWSCVMNRAIFADSGPHELYTPPTAVSASEHAQIEKRLDGFVKDFLEVCRPNIPELQRKLQKPLRPLWVTQSSTLPPSAPSFPSFHPIILCTASRRVHGGEVSEGGYIQGAADDHEAWALGLTPKIFWTNHTRLLNTNEDDLPSLINDLVQREKGPDAVAILVKPTTSLYIASSQNLDISPFEAIISCTPEPLTTTNAEHLRMKKYLHLPLVPGKLGSRDLRAQLSRLPPFIEGLPILEGNACRILICDPTGKDLSVGVALAILCLYADENGRMSNQPTRGRIDKLYIKQRLTWITTTSPVLNPSRETLKAVNSFLMPDPSSTSKAPLAQEGTKLVLVNEDGTPVTALAPLESTESAKDLPASLSEQASPSGNPTPQSVPIATTLFRKLPTSPTKPWTFKRKLTSKLASHPSGTVTGTATFTSLEQGRETLLYAEEGEFITDTGLNFTARRKYVYRLTTLPADSVTEDSENNTHISVYFHSDESNGLDPTAKDLFVEMGPLSPVEGGKVWEAGNKDQHLCGEDLYTASWRFGGRMVESKKVDEGEDLWWEVRYDVKGPRKDYVSETRYTMV